MWRRAKERLGWASLATGKLEEIFISLRFSVKVPLNKNNNTHTCSPDRNTITSIALLLMLSKCVFIYFFLAQVEFILPFIKYFLLQWLINDFNIEG